MADDESSKVTLKVGDTVHVTAADKVGKIAFIGTTKFKPGKWVGIVLDHAGGKNDGSVAGVKYFSCPPKHGLFVKPHMIRPVDAPKTPARKSAVPRSPKASAMPKSPASSARKMATPKAAAPKAAATPKAAAATPKAAAAATPKSAAAKPAASGGMRGKIAGLEKKLEDANGVIAEMQKQLAAAEASAGAGGAAPASNLSDLNAAQEKKLLAELEEANKTIDSLRKDLTKAKATVADLEPYKPYKAKFTELEKKVKSMTLEKDLADETIETLQLEWETTKEELLICQEDLEMAQLQTAETLQEMISQLPTGQAEIAQLNQSNTELTAASMKLRDQYVSTKNAYDTYKMETEGELEELRSKGCTVDRLEEELQNTKEIVAELQEGMEEASGYEEMVEKLSEKNMDLLGDNRDLKEQINQLKDLIDANEEVEEGHLELEDQLQTEVDQREMELGEVHRQLKLKQSQIEELNTINRQFRGLVKDLESEAQELMSQQSLTEEQKSEQKKGRANNMRMQAQINEVRHRTIEHITSKMEAREQSHSYSFLKSYIPDNVSVEEAALNLQLKAEKLLFKSISAAKALHELCGANSSKGDATATRAYEVCDKLLEFSHSASKLKFCLRVSDATTFDNMVSERDTLNGADGELDTLLKAIASDDINETTSMENLNVAHENVIGFVAAHFPDDDDNVDETAALVRRGPPTALLDVQRLLFLSGAGMAKLRAISDLLNLVPRAKGPDGAVLEDQANAKYQEVYGSMQGMQQSNMDLCSKMLTQAQTFEIMVGNSKSHNPKALEQDMAMCSKYALGCNLRLKELYTFLETTINSRSVDDDEEKRRVQLTEQLNSRFETETSDRRLMEEMQSYRTTLEDLSKKLDEGETSDGEIFDPPVWETRALQVRTELMQSASLKSSLEDATKRVESKTRDLFAAKKLVRDSQAKVDVLTSKMIMLQNKSNEVDDMREQLEKYSRNAKDNDEGIQTLQADLDKYASANKALRKKVLKLKYELKRQENTRSAGAAVVAGAGITTTTGKNITSLQVAADEVNLMARTVAVLRQQMAQLKSSHSQSELLQALPPLPAVKPLQVYDAAQHSDPANVAEVSRRQASLSPFAIGSLSIKSDLAQVGELRGAVASLSSRLASIRTAPALIDLSKVKEGSHAGQQWLTQVSVSQSLKKDTRDLQAKLAGFVASKQDQAFRTLFAAVPASTHDGAAASTAGSKLIGRVTLPVAPAGSSNCKVSLRPRQFAQLHSIFVK